MIARPHRVDAEHGRSRGRHRERAHGRARRTVSADAAHSSLRRSGSEGLLPREDRGLPPSLHRAGGQRRRSHRCAAPDGLRRRHLSRPWHRLGARYDGPRVHGRTLREGDGVLEGPRRQHALFRRRPADDGRLWDRRGTRSARRGLCVHVEVPRDGRRDRVLPRRGCGEHR